MWLLEVVFNYSFSIRHFYQFVLKICTDLSKGEHFMKNSVKLYDIWIIQRIQMY